MSQGAVWSNSGCRAVARYAKERTKGNPSPGPGVSERHCGDSPRIREAPAGVPGLPVVVTDQTGSPPAAGSHLERRVRIEG